MVPGSSVAVAVGKGVFVGVMVGVPIDASAVKVDLTPAAIVDRKSVV